MQSLLKNLVEQAKDEERARLREDERRNRPFEAAVATIEDKDRFVNLISEKFGK